MPGTKALERQKDLRIRLEVATTRIALMGPDPAWAKERSKLQEKQEALIKEIRAIDNGYDPYLKGMSWIPSS